MKRIIGLLIVLTVVIISCSKDKDEMKYSSVMVTLSDDPVLYDSVWINVQGVEIHTEADGWHSLPAVLGFYDILQYQNAVDTLVVDSTSIPAGTISQIRLILGDGNYVVIGGVHYPLSLSSEDETGLKVNVHSELMPNVVYTVHLDFVANESIVLTGNGTYKLKPVVKATVE